MKNKRFITIILKGRDLPFPAVFHFLTLEMFLPADIELLIVLKSLLAGTRSQILLELLKI